MSSDRDAHLEELEELLRDHPGDPILGAELDGFVTGIVLCPEQMKPDEWVSKVWVHPSEPDVFAFPSEEERQAAIACVLTHYDGIRAMLTKGGERYRPIYPVDNDGEVIWELWLNGFQEAMALQPLAWERMRRAKGAIGRAVACLDILGDIDERRSSYSAAEIEELQREVPDFIPVLVEFLFSCSYGGGHARTLDMPRLLQRRYRVFGEPTHGPMSEDAVMQLEELHDMLAALPGDAMSVSELDGFVAGLAICPELVPMEEWMPAVLGTEDDDPLDILADGDFVVEIIAGVLTYCEMVAAALQEGDAYGAAFERDATTGEIAWQRWADGFLRVLAMRPDRWDAMASGSEDARQALGIMQVLIEVSQGIGQRDEHLVAEVMQAAPDLLSGAAQILFNCRGGRKQLPARRQAKPGRNEPCPCGSGRKYKKCCGAN